MLFFLTEACEEPHVLRVIYFLRLTLNFIFSIMPFILIVIIMIDFIKSLLSGNFDKNNGLNILAKRVISCLAVFFTYTIINFFLGQISNSVSFLSCYTNSTLDKIEFYQKKYDVEHPKKESSSSKLNLPGKDKETYNDYEKGRDKSSSVDGDCETKAAELIAKMMYVEAQSSVGKKDLFYFASLASVIVNNSAYWSDSSNPASYKSIYHINDKTEIYDEFESYRDDKLVGFKPWYSGSVALTDKGNIGFLLYASKLALTGNYTFPSNMIFQTTCSSILSYNGAVWDKEYSPNCFGMEGSSLKSKDVFGKELPKDAHGAFSTSVKHYKELAKKFEQDDYSKFNSDNICS